MAREKQVEENRTIPNQPPQPPPQPYLVDHSRPCKELQYAAKLVSGIPGPSPSDPGHDIVAPGRYYTAVNVHNPATCKTVTFRWKAAEATPNLVPPGRISRFQSIRLRPDEAVEIDGPIALQALGYSPTRFVKGFVVIESPCPLDVVAVYSVGALPTGHTPGNVVAFDTERVPERQIEACRDLKLDLSTGVAEWDLIVAPSGPIPRPASVIAQQDLDPNWQNQPGAQWISAQVQNQPVAPGTYTFQTCFTLCSGFDNPILDLSVRVDDFADIWLNTQPIGNASGQGPTVLSPTGLIFHPGLNTLSFVVTNAGVKPNPMGLNVHATLTADRGACPDCGDCCSDCGAEKVYPEVNP